MAANRLSLHLLSLLTILILNTNLSSCCYQRIFSFGDSLADTGNFVYMNKNKSTDDTVFRSPYGETYFHRPTGRFSNGRLIVDFIAEALGMPFLQPYLAGRTAEDFKYGTNFAVGGVTALNVSFFRVRGVAMPDLEGCLGTQLEWFKDLLKLLCSDDQSDCKDVMEKSLFLVGEIGGNDYNVPFLSGVTLEKIQTFVPSVIAAISSTITELIGLGAKTLVVPGNLPIGCVPGYLTVFQSTTKEDYDMQTGCLNWLNDFAKYHNDLLLQQLDRLRMRFPNVTITYADYYGAAMDIFLDPLQLGFKNALVACCGVEGPYGCSMTASARCGAAESKVCNDPQEYASWDGLHPTEAAYKVIADGLLKGPYATPPITTSCLQVKEFGVSMDNKASS